jgi:hypothetical protein
VHLFLGIQVPEQVGLHKTRHSSLFSTSPCAHDHVCASVRTIVEHFVAFIDDMAVDNMHNAHRSAPSIGAASASIVQGGAESRLKGCADEIRCKDPRGSSLRISPCRYNLARRAIQFSHKWYRYTGDRRGRGACLWHISLTCMSNMWLISQCVDCSI